MFKIIGLKIYAFLGVVIAVLLAFVGYRGRKIDELEHDAKINDEIKSIHEQQLADRSEVLQNEPREIIAELKERRTSSRSDRFNKL